MKRFIVQIAFVFSFFFLITSCSSPEKKSVPTLQPQTVQSREQRRVDLLYSYYQHWQGTPYRMGGLSKNGIDCSGFVFLTYRSIAGIKLPRTTRLQMQLGRKIPLQDLEPGDLLFFKTGWYTRHVGIYLQNGQFMHASTSQGVTLSGLSEKYWREAFYMAKRIDFR